MGLKVGKPLGEPTSYTWLSGTWVEDELDPHFPKNQAGGKKPICGPGSRISKSSLIDCHGQVTVGEHTFFGHRVMVLTGGHDPRKFGAARLSGTTHRDVTIGNGVWVCSGAIICPGVTIGDHAVIGPGAVVMRNVPAYTVVAGNPARRVCRLRSEGDGT